ncbi:MAG TPA: phosphoribosyl-AMP cyclohydrolase [Candidatus Acidoferrales bacterium]|nr:phosphoribosyl-AMP cyclohydrolase [Candidatus Acidoferrales bacterium]
MDEIIAKLKFDDRGLITAVTQDYETGEILMLAHMNSESFRKTVETGQAVYWSRARNRLWHKGEESGNFQNVKAILIDCDGDAVVLKVEQIGGAACHTGNRSCFSTKIENGKVVDIGVKIFDPEKVYKHKGE